MNTNQNLAASMEKTIKYYKDNRDLFGVENEYGEVMYPDEEVYKVIKMAYEEGLGNKGVSIKEKELLQYFLMDFVDVLGNNSCNDVSEKIWEGWTVEERQQFVRSYYEWNGSPEEYDPSFLYLPDFAIVGFLSEKILK